MFIKYLKVAALIVGIIASIFSIVDFFITDRAVTRTVQRFFQPHINIEQNIDPEALKSMIRDSDGTIRIEKGITIRREDG